MEGVGPPREWIGREVRVILQDRIPDSAGRAGPEFDAISGVLVDANEFGTTVEQAQSVRLVGVVAEEADRSLRFIPWTAIRGIQLH